MPPKLYRESFALRGRAGVHLPERLRHPVLPGLARRSGFTSANSPQNVKNTLTSIPEAAAVVDRISVGQTRSRCPSQATIVILFFLLMPSVGLALGERLVDQLADRPASGASSGAPSASFVASCAVWTIPITPS